MNCKRCNNKIAINAKFCSKCGLKIPDIVKEDIQKTRIKSPSYQKDRLFKLLFTGRIGRLRYFLYILIIYMLFIPVFILSDQITLYNNGVSIINYIIDLIFPLAIIPIVAKRFHDFGVQGYFALILFLVALFNIVLGLDELKLLSLIFGLLLIFKKGDNETNKYGEVRT